MDEVSDRGDKGGKYAFSITLAEEFLNEMSRSGIGDGFSAAEVVHTLELPMMGPMELKVGLTITEVTFQMREEDQGRLHATVRAEGAVQVLGEVPMQPLPGAAHLRAEVLVAPHVELREDGSFAAVLDLVNCEMLSVTLERIAGVETTSIMQEQLGQLLISTIGGDLFQGLAAAMDTVGLELDSAVGSLLHMLGCSVGVANLEVLDGHLLLGIHGVDDLDGHARHVSGTGEAVSVTVASGVFPPLFQLLASGALGVDLPFEADFRSEHKQLSGRIRNTRLVEHPLIPDLRPGLHYSVVPRLRGEFLELVATEVWVELPFVPAPINRLSRLLGGAASLAPLKVRVPSTMTIPLHPELGTSMVVRISRVATVAEGITLTLESCTSA